MKEQNEFQKQAVIRRAAKFEHTPETLQFLSDIVTTAIEGGIGYWSQCRDYVWQVDGKEVPAHAEIKDIEDDQPAEWTLLDVYVIEAGIMAIINRLDVKLSPGRVSSIAGAWATLEGGDIDAELADCIVQAGIFGEVIYG